ncbi:transcriptional regulator [Pseudomonas sp. Marseille-Q1929]|uniref:transcriptional regulator n=1 Tax=Pseudomonas sp. Marseille-Q1929 TaxID=2730402 RepID=UPI001A904427|nr:transcriptional regulator [Pseudomonas sp. Marseille-Q1929]MBO0492099.1 transcriptional regulator [Pseudomonas sp. Marseille-Q1929]
MSAHGLPDDDRHRQVFLDNLVSGSAAHQQLAPGIKVCALHAGHRRGLALEVSREALQTGQLQQVLERRFEQATMFEGCFVYLDAQGSLVIWQALPAQRDAVEKALSQMLSLANIDSLNRRSTR